MNHADVKKNLADYLEGDLSLEDRAMVDAHLDSCDPCSTEVDEMLRTIRLLRTLPEPEIPPMIAANVMRRIRAGESRLGFFGRVGRFLGSVLEPSFVLPASAIAVAAMVVTVTQGTLIGSNSNERSEARSFAGVRPSANRPDRLVGANSGVATTSRSPNLASLASSSAPGRGEHGFSGRGSVAVPDRSAAVSRSTPRTIRLRVDGSGVARLSVSPGPSNGRRFTSDVPEALANEFARVMYGGRASLAASTLVAADRGRSGSDPSISRVSDHSLRSLVHSQARPNERSASSAGQDAVDPRDAWLALGFEDPVEFARYIAGRNLAEQELWAARLSERAMERGLMADFVETLRTSGDETAMWVSDDFAAYADRAVPGDVSSAGASPLP